MRTEGVDVGIRFIEGTMQADGIRRLVLRIQEGEIHLAPSNDGTIHYAVEIEGQPELLPTWNCMIKKLEGITILQTPFRGEIRVLKCEVQVPPTISAIEAHSTVGSIDVLNFHGDILAISEQGEITVNGAGHVEASNVDGAIAVNDCESCSLRSIEGAIIGTRIRGNAQIESQKGMVKINRILGNLMVATTEGSVAVSKPSGRLRLITNSGDIELEVTGTFGGGEVQTYSGDVYIQLERASVEFRAETLSGKIDAPCPVMSAGMGPRRCAFQLGTGAKRLYVKNVLGDIEVNA